MKTRMNSNTRCTGAPRTLALAALGSSLLLAACDQGESEAAATQETVEEVSPQKPVKETNDSLSDEDIQSAILNRLLVEEVFPYTSVQVNVKDGIVKLEGEAFSLQAKNITERIIRSTRGVRGVIDRLSVPATDIADQTVQEHVNEALLIDSATESYEVDAKVKEGQVTLSGDVDSWADRELAEEVASRVIGVRSVINQLDVDSPAVRPDLEIQRDIVHRLENDVLVDNALLKVDVDSGVVKLAGLVGSAAEKHRARSKAWVNGVVRVDAKDLDIEWWDRDRFEKSSPAALIPNAEVTSAVQNALAFDERIASNKIAVQVDRGRAILTGEVPSLRDKKLAAETAGDTLGVRRVQDYLRVVPSEKAEDDRLEARVERALSFNPYLAEWSGSVRAKDGVVTLFGVARTNRQKEQAEDAASRVLGVVHVENDLRVTIRNLEDIALKEDVEELILWNVFVEPKNVEVTVDRGVVTLSGEVEDIRAYRAADAAADRAGAQVVFNRLSLKG